MREAKASSIRLSNQPQASEPPPPPRTSGTSPMPVSNCSGGDAPSAPRVSSAHSAAPSALTLPGGQVGRQQRRVEGTAPLPATGRQQQRPPRPQPLGAPVVHVHDGVLQGAVQRELSPPLGHNALHHLAIARHVAHLLMKGQGTAGAEAEHPMRLPLLPVPAALPRACEKSSRRNVTSPYAGAAATPALPPPAASAGGSGISAPPRSWLSGHHSTASCPRCITDSAASTPAGSGTRAVLSKQPCSLACRTKASSSSTSLQLAAQAWNHAPGGSWPAPSAQARRSPPRK